jgi:hypothetical protein
MSLVLGTQFIAATQLTKAEGAVRETILRVEDYPPRPASPYEERWPGYRLPRYYEKPFFLRQDHYPLRGCFVHVGKTAGSSVGCAMGFQLHCQRELRHPRGYLPRLTSNLLHSDVNDCTAEHDYYLFSVRDPLERIQSWYLYEEKKLQVLYSNCSLPTLNDLAERGLEKYEKYKERVRDATTDRLIPEDRSAASNLHNNNGSSSSDDDKESSNASDDAGANWTIDGGGGSGAAGYRSATTTLNSTTATATANLPQPLATVRCRLKARRVIRGTEKVGSHAYYNYARYMTQIPDGAVIGVIRTPHLVQDWNSMEAYLTERVRGAERQSTVTNDNEQNPWYSSRNPFAAWASKRSRTRTEPVQITRLGSKNRTPTRKIGVKNETNSSITATAESLSSSSSTGATRVEDDRRYLSPRARALLCEALCDEIQVYKKILKRAVNLREADVRESLDELRRTCPREADLPGACLY